MFATHIDLYQLTSLIPHWEKGLAHEEVWMSFFSRRLPQTVQGEPVRDYLVWAGLGRCLSTLQTLRFDDERIATLCEHPMLGPALLARPNLIDTLRTWRFKGEVWSPAEGTLIWANQAQNEQGQPFEVKGVKPSAQTPYLQIKTDLLSAKLIETPLLSIINHMTMVASKSARICTAAGDRPIYEFGSRRTHIEAAVDAAYAAYLGGCAASSNVEAAHRYQIPMVGTMDHFAVQAWESKDQPVTNTEYAFFKSFYEIYPESAILLVDTYDMYSERGGIRAAVAATQGNLKGIRIDSDLTVENISNARTLLNELGAIDAQIIVSGGIDEYKIKELAGAPIDGFGVGEKLVTSSDAPVGVGAVGKLSRVGHKPTMKQATGTGKATLPGPIQVFRGSKGDRVALLGTPARRGEIPLIEKVWETDEPVNLPQIDATKAWVHDQRRTLYIPHRVYLDDQLVETISRLVTSAHVHGK